MAGDEPATASLVTLETGWGVFNLFDAAIQQKKAMDRRREKMILAAMASTSKPGTAAYSLFGFFTSFSLITAVPILVAVSLPVPDDLGSIGVPIALVYVGTAVHGAVYELRRSGSIGDRPAETCGRETPSFCPSGVHLRRDRRQRLPTARRRLRRRLRRRRA